jgi:uncharacterized protein (DUF362 family)
MKRRNFFKILSLGGASFAFTPVIKAVQSIDVVNAENEIETNIADAIKIPRTDHSMPGLYPGKVAKVVDDKSVIDGVPQEEAAYTMLKTGMLMLTGAEDLKSAWLKFVSPNDKIGLKVNPVAGKLLTTSHAVTRSVIKQLKEAGIPEKNIIIWDRREMQLHETGYTPENYPGIKIMGTECQDDNGGFFNAEGQLYSEERIDKKHYFYADVEGDYDAYTLPFMVNGGKYSYFATICTKEVDKIINIPILKNAGTTTTLCMKNLAYGSISNTGRLHKNLWHETCAYACAFPPLRDKVVLNIVDGLVGCFEGGPSANPQYICNYNMMLVGSDPVAVDRIGHDVIIAKRIEEGIQKEDKKSAFRFIDIAQDLKLGVGDRDKIELVEKNI